MLQFIEPWNNGVTTYTSIPDISNTEVNLPTLEKHLGCVQEKTILDYGCGSGRFARRLKKIGAKRVVATDISFPMIELARETDPDEHVRYHHMPDNSLFFLDTGTFDVAVANLVFMMLPKAQDILQSMREIHRVLRPEGTFIYLITHPCFIEKGAHDYHNVFETDFHYFQEGSAYKFVLQDKDGLDVQEDFIDYHHTLTTYINMTLQAGFQLARIDEITYPDTLIEKYAVTHYYQTFPQTILIACTK